jgi:hypothetical protein
MRPLYLVSIAFAAGVLGGVLGTQITRWSAEPNGTVVKARQFELIDERGNIVAFWGSDQNSNAVLAFAKSRQSGQPPSADLKDPKNQRMSVGVLADGSPLLSFMGNDGQARLRGLLTEYDKPILMLEDAGGPRVSLGIQQSDTHDPADDNWALTFEPETDKATIGIIKDPISKHLYGGLWINGSKIKLP